MDLDTYKNFVAQSYKDFKSNVDTNNFQDIINFVNNLNPNLVIDAGCGDNPFKNKIKNIIGFDIRNTNECDLVGSFQDMKEHFKIDSADVILCFDSLGFGLKEHVIDNINLMKSWIRKDGYIFVIDRSDKGVSAQDRVKYPLRFFYNDSIIQEITDQLNLKFYSKPILNNKKYNWVWTK